MGRKRSGSVSTRASTPDAPIKPSSASWIERASPLARL